MIRDAFSVMVGFLLALALEQHWLWISTCFFVSGAAGMWLVQHVRSRQ